MNETVVWADDGTPRSPRFDDIYRSSGTDGQGGLAQSRHVFLQGCGLLGDQPLWRDAPHWTVLETGFGLGLNFLACWHAWRQDPHRPVRLHFVSVEAYPVSADDLRRSVAAFPELQVLADELVSQWWGLLPGFHRLRLDQGRVLLTLCVGDIQPMLKELQACADSVFLDGFNPAQNPDMWRIDALKAVTRHVRRGTRVATWSVAREVRDGLTQLGYSVHKTQGLAPKRHCLHAVYEPHWQPRTADSASRAMPDLAGPCVVIGSGLAGAACARALAERGWQVTVLDAGAAPAAGASGLPVGLVAPHTSPDDSITSRLSRAGVRCMRYAMQKLLVAGTDWSDTGVLEHRLPGKTRKGGTPAHWAADWAQAAQVWSQAAAAPEGALWHSMGAWLRPAQLVNALLDHPLIRWQGQTPMNGLRHGQGKWQVLHGERVLAQAPRMVLACGPETVRLLAPHLHEPATLPIRPLRGQLSWGLMADTPNLQDASALPHTPVNGHGSFVHSIPSAEGLAWYAGSTFDRDHNQALVYEADHAENFERLQQLLPHTASALHAAFAPALHPAPADAPPASSAARVRGWAAVRCTAPDRLPLVGEVPGVPPGLWISTAMGARGLTLALLCADIVAARWSGEPLPVENQLARALLAERFA